MVICNQLVDVLKFAVSIDSWLSHTWLKCYRYVGVNPNFCDIIRPDIPKKGTLANDILPFKEIQVGEIYLFRQTECMKKNVYHDFKQSGVHMWVL